MASLAIKDHSLRERYLGGGEEAGNARRVLERYYPLLTEVFPIAGEIETIAAYDEYLRDPAMDWDIVVLSDAADGRIVGGIHWQALRGLGTAWLDAVAWVEHVWLVNDPAFRRYDRFRDLLSAVRNHMHRRRVDVGFMEFNDPEKMTPQDMARDAAGGLSTRDRLRLWAHVGLCELIHRTADGQRVPAPYAQPAMDHGPPVRMLSLGFFAFARKLAESRIPTTDYLQILYRAHATIRGVDPAHDPTCREYTAAVRALAATDFEFAPLKDRLSPDRQQATGRS
jgi:hypothetical protein